MLSLSLLSDFNPDENGDDANEDICCGRSIHAFPVGFRTSVPVRYSHPAVVIIYISQVRKSARGLFHDLDTIRQSGRSKATF